MAEKPEDINNESGNEGEPVKIEIPKEEYDKLVEEHANSKQAVTNLTTEIKEVRTKKQEAEEALKEATKTPVEPVKIPDGELTTEKIVEAATRAAQAAVEATKQIDLEKFKNETILEFKSSKKVFDEDNDPAGIKYSAFEKKLDIFNMDSAKSKEEILDRLNSAFNLLPGQENVIVDTKKQPSSTPSDPAGGGDPTPTDPDNLSAKEKKVIRDTFDGDTERFLKIKAKRPDYVRELLDWVR